jgi:hypothetical protein
LQKNIEKIKNEWKHECLAKDKEKKIQMEEFKARVRSECEALIKEIKELNQQMSNENYTLHSVD